MVFLKINASKESFKNWTNKRLLLKRDNEISCFFSGHNIIFTRIHIPAHNSCSFRRRVILWPAKIINIFFLFWYYWFYAFLSFKRSDGNDLKVAFALQQSDLKYVFSYYSLDCSWNIIKIKGQYFFRDVPKQHSKRCAVLRVAIISAKNHKRQRRKRQSVTANP